MLSKRLRWIEYGALLSFLFGAMVSGLLLTAIYFLKGDSLYGHYLASAACGLLYVRLEFMALIVPAIICFVLALPYKIYMYATGSSIKTTSLFHIRSLVTVV